RSRGGGRDRARRTLEEDHDLELREASASVAAVRRAGGGAGSAPGAPAAVGFLRGGQRHPDDAMQQPQAGHHPRDLGLARRAAHQLDRQDAQDHVADSARALTSAAAALFAGDEVDGPHEPTSVTARPAATVTRPGGSPRRAPGRASATTAAATGTARPSSTCSTKPGTATAGPVTTARPTITPVPWAE